MYWLCPIHSLETRRGRGRSYWLKADKTFASRAARKRKEKCAYMCEQTLPRQAQVILTATMHDVGIRCVHLEHVALPLNFCSATLFLSFEVRPCCDSAVDFTCKKVFPSLWSLKSKSPVISTWTKRRISTSWGTCRLLGPVARGELPPPRYGCCRLLASPRGIKPSLRTCRSNSMSFHFTQTFPEKVLVVSNHALFVVQEQSLPDVGLHVASSMGPQVLTAKGQLPYDRDRCARSFRSTPNCSHKQLARLTSLSFVPSWKRKPFLIFVFRIWSRRMFIWSQWCAWSSG